MSIFLISKKGVVIDLNFSVRTVSAFDFRKREVVLFWRSVAELCVLDVRNMEL